MENVLNILWEWRFIIAIVVAIGIYAIFEWSNFKQLAYKAMLVAKDKAKDKILQGGKAQEDWVVAALYGILPARLKAFIRSPEAIRPAVHWLYNKALDKLDDGQFNNSRKEE